MKKITLGGALEAPEIALGCRRLWQAGEQQAELLISTALEQGVNFIDLADVYGDGKSEELFAKAAGMSPSVREQFLIQTKCGIRGAHTPETHYDFDRDYILNSVDGSLKRLNTEYIDVLLLHRPDTLMEPDEVAEAFETLYSSGKVRYFGVSNFNPGQIELLQKYTKRKLIADQLQLSIAHSSIIDSGINVNVESETASGDAGILEYCRLHDVTIQAWSPFYYGFLEGVFLGSDKFPELNKNLNELAGKYDVAPSAIAVAWILRHPAHMQVVAGTKSAEHLAEICGASGVRLTKSEWYALYKSAGHIIP